MNTTAAKRLAAHGITREMLEGDVLRQVIEAQSPAAHVLDDCEHRQSIECTLAGRPPGAEADPALWVFGYGSLPWNPCIDLVDRCPVRVHGFHREFCLWETDGRGSPDHPGLTLALAPGGACRGIALRVDPDNLRRELLLLWRREMVTNVYCPRWVRMRANGRVIDGVAFVVNRSHPAYTGRLSDARIAQLVANGRGPLGPCIEYLDRTVDQLEVHGISDSHLKRVRELAHGGQNGRERS